MKNNAPALHRIGCKGCPQNTAPGIQSPKMEPTLGDGPIYFMAEAPGRDEDENSGKSLTGPSGRLLRECIPDGEEDNCTFDNVINCRPAKNRPPEWVEIECCRPRRIKWIEQVKPKLIVGLGAVPMSWALNSTDLQGMRGRVFAIKVGNHSCWFMPTYHPSFILRTAYDKRKPLQSQFGFCFRMDIARAFSIVGDLTKPVIDGADSIVSGIQCFDGREQTHFQAVLGLLEQAQAAPLKAVDLETKGLRPYAAGAAVMTASISFGTTNFSFAIDHPKSGWEPDQRLFILDAFERLLKDDTIKVAHNAPFELEWFIFLFNKNIVNHLAWHCSQMQAHFIDERRGKAHGGDDKRASYQSLDFLCKQYFGISYKSRFKLNKKDMSKSDLGETLIYNSADTKYTLRLFHTQEKLLKKLGLYNAYLDALPRQASVALMQHLGVDTDQAEVKRIQTKLGGEIGQIVGRMNDLKVVKAFIKDNGAFNPASGPDVIKLFKDYLHRPEVAIIEEKGTRYSVDKNVLAQIDHPLSSLLIEYRNRSVLKSTFVDPLELGVGTNVHPDGKIHCNINTTFAETGRTSADDPNTQNYPQRNDAWVRKQVTAGKGNVLLAFDYGQLEACGAAVCSKDKALVKALWEDYDIHMDFALKVAAKCPELVGGSMKDAKVAKKFRSIVKNKMVFPAIYGAQAKSIAGYLDMPEDKAEELMDGFWGTFYGLKSWQDRLIKGYYENGYVESPMGRRRHYPLRREQAINHPIQCWAAEVVCDAMSRLSYEAASTDNWHIHPRLNIHDDITVVMPDDNKLLEPAIETIYRALLSPPYKLNVPLSVTASIGANWYEMSEIGKFWSHRDL